MEIKFGRLVKSVGETILPANLSPSQQNVDIDNLGEASRRKGFVRALDTEFTGEISLIKKWVDYDGEESYIVIDEDGINRVT